MSDGRTVVIGAGPAGLASAAELRRKGVPVVVLERADAIGASWRGRYDRLRLNSSRWFSKLPGGRYARGTAVFPSRERFHGPLLHAAEYRNPEPFRDGDVLVVGPGCSGMEIAYDLAEGGARKVSLAVRTPPNLLVRSPMGPAFALALMRVRPQRADRIVNFIRSKEIGDLTEYGLPVPEEGTFSRLRRLGVAPAIIDKPVIQAIRDRRIEIVAGVQSLDDTGVGLADGTRIEPEAVIAATGYRCGLEPVVGHLDVLDDEGVPRAFGAEPAAPGLRFVGYVHLPAHLRHAGREARWAAKAVAFDLRAQVGPAASDRVAAFGT